jgi:glycerol uptake facilitator-like aquaporin
VIYLTFTDPGSDQELFKLLAVQPSSGAQLYKVFFTELFLTFILTYVAFTAAYEEAEEALKAKSGAVKKVVTLDSMDPSNVRGSILNRSEGGLTLFSSNPQSKSGFAPFAIGFTLFVLACFGGTGGGVLNPARMFGPALFSGVWDSCYVYWGGEFAGAGLAALTVVYIQHVNTLADPFGKRRFLNPSSI